MKQILFKPTAMKRLVWVALCATLFSFSELGGESYTIYLNDKLIAQEYVTRQAPLPNLLLYQADANDQLLVYYNHCGRIGKARSLTLKDEEQKVLKEWRFADAINEHSPMTIKTKDIIGLAGKGANKLNLVYTSSELPDGKVLAYVVLNNKGVDTAKR